jgi:hypothetical protein
MKAWIAAAALTAVTAAGSIVTVQPAAAAKVITVPRSHVQTARYQRERATIRRYGEPAYAGGAYYVARPFFYIPAPFPLGFDFGFGW